MQVVFHKIPIDNCCIAGIVASVHKCDTQSGRRRSDMRSSVARRRVRGLAFVTADIAEMLKNVTHFFAYNGLPLGLPPRNLHF